jgi:hypothetical protein
MTDLVEEVLARSFEFLIEARHYGEVVGLRGGEPGWIPKDRGGGRKSEMRKKGLC